MSRLILVIALVAALLATALPAWAESKTSESTKPIRVIRAPNEGIQPQAVVGKDGTIHMVYYDGVPQSGDVYYVTSEDAKKWSEPIRVNSQEGSAQSAGIVKFAQIALGKNDRVHVVWGGSRKAEPKPKAGGDPQLYTRMKADGSGFEPQRNLMQRTGKMVASGSVAADSKGNVYVIWQAVAPQPGKKRGKRTLFAARSTDDGKTFSKEVNAEPYPAFGACGCCAVKAMCDSKGTVYVIYRTMKSPKKRPMRILVSTNKGRSFRPKATIPWGGT